MSRPFFRITLATALLIAGLAPVGAPIVSDSASRQPVQPSDPIAGSIPEAAPFAYRLAATSLQATRIERSDDDGRTWHVVAEIPAAITQIQAIPGDEQIVTARSTEAVWVSRDGGMSWSLGGALPSRPLALAVAGKDAKLLLVGTESVGMLVSHDLGESWQAVHDPALTDGTAPLAVSALAVDPADDSILYAATGIWLGTAATRLTPIGTFVSVDQGQHWFMLARAPLGAAPINRLSPMADQPLTVMAGAVQGAETTLSMVLSAELLSQLENQDAGVRASVARALGLIGDTAASTTLLARLTDPDPLAGDRAAEALGRLGDASVVPALLDLLREHTTDELVRARAAQALGLLQAQEAVDDLAAALRAGAVPTARRAAEALANIGTPEALAALTVPLADSEMTAARHAAMIGLESAGAMAVEPLTTALVADQAALRANAAEMLGWVRAETAIAALAQALTDADPEVRTRAAWALGEIGTTEARTMIAAAARTERDPAALDALAAALKQPDRATVGRTPVSALSETLLARVSQIPPTRWTFLIITTALAATLLWMRPQRKHHQTY